MPLTENSKPKTENSLSNPLRERAEFGERVGAADADE
jgi:hypothetical protein